MVCQKIVAKKRDEDRNITARFCQIQTGQTSPCDFIQKKIHANYDELIHCSICEEDNCNKSSSITLSITLIFLSSLLLLLKFQTIHCYKFKFKNERERTPNRRMIIKDIKKLQLSFRVIKSEKMLCCTSFSVDFII